MFKYNDFGVPDGSLKDLRTQIYHSNGLGYAVFPGFIEPVLVDHIRRLWTEIEIDYSHQPFKGWAGVGVNSPDLAREQPNGSRIFNNFFHNRPLDPVTHAVCVYISILRNRVEGKDPLTHILPHDQSATAYRVAIEKGAHVAAPPHRDWVEEKTFDLAALQATLFLSKNGVDYSGDGMTFMTNTGEMVVMGRDVAIDPGDLVFWKYNNLHSVTKVRTEPGQLGFMRIIHSTFVEGLGEPKKKT